MASQKRNPPRLSLDLGGLLTVKRIPDGGITKMITQVEELDNLPAGPCADCGETFAGELLDDEGLCLVCDVIAYEKVVKAAADAEDAALYKEGMRIWDKALAEVQAQDIARAEAEWAKHLAEVNPWEALRARERTVKDREISRRERRQDGYDADDASTGELANVEPDWEAYDAMTMDVVRSTIGKLPAILSRTDGRTILYAQKVNTVAARPNGGKSWVAIKCAIEVVERGGRVLMLDFDNKRPGVLAGRAQDMAVEGIFQNKDSFQFKDVELVKYPGAMAAAVQWLLAAEVCCPSFYVRAESRYPRQSRPTLRT